VAPEIQSGGLTGANPITYAGGAALITDGSHTANLTLLGNYSLSQFTSATDGHSGTVITDPPPASSPVLWASTPDADALLWQPTPSEAAMESSSPVHLRSSGVEMPAGGQGSPIGTGLGCTGLLWQPATPLADARLMAGAGFAGQVSTMSALTMHQRSLGG
jgi:hypothetical protein